IVFFDIDPEICLANVYKRIENNEPRDDIAPGFDNSITDPEFIKYVQNFKTLRQPLIEKMVSSFKGTMVRLNHYDEAERFIENLPNIQAKQ
ncbi:MAG TPA: hypothetical protein PK113_04090, partial [Bacillota bacterium]|nr:hypothetical protein [Bacillota bacterium]